MRELPSETNKIFSILSKGKFISEKGENEKYFKIIKDNFLQLKPYFLYIDFKLEFGNGYYFFSKNNVAEQEIERKLLQFEKFINILDLFNSLENKITIGTIFTIAKITAECEETPRLREKLNNMNIEGKTNDEKIKKIINELEKNAFIELYDKVDRKYLILDAYDYLNDIVFKIKIS